MIKSSRLRLPSLSSVVGFIIGVGLTVLGTAVIIVVFDIIILLGSGRGGCEVTDFGAYESVASAAFIGWYVVYDVETVALALLSNGLIRSVELVYGLVSYSAEVGASAYLDVVKISGSSPLVLFSLSTAETDDGTFDGDLVSSIFIYSADVSLAVRALGCCCGGRGGGSCGGAVFFFFGKFYMSPNMPANVFLKFFMVSSASSITEVWVWGLVRELFDTPETVDDWDACESRRPTFARFGDLSSDDSVGGGGSETLLKLPSLPMDPTPGVERSGIGGGAPGGADERTLPASDGAFSSVGLPPRDEIDERDVALVNGGRHTFCIRATTKSAI